MLECCLTSHNEELGIANWSEKVPFNWVRNRFLAEIKMHQCAAAGADAGAHSVAIWAFSLAPSTTSRAIGHS